MALAFIALGSNLGDRRDFLRRALDALCAQPRVVVERMSSLYETAPVGGPAEQNHYLNAAAVLRTERTPDELLQVLLEIEASLGRVRTERDGPRTIDLDLLLYDDVIRDDPQLTLPHPRLHQRLFVLQPLAEIASGVVHPLLKRTIAELLAELQGIRPLGPTPGRELAGLRAVVTGSTSGIGKAIALELASGGADVIVHGRRSRDSAEDVAVCLRRHGVRSDVRLADLHEPEQCQRLVTETWELWQGIDIWINNAGADTLTGDAARWPFERKLEELFVVDVRATMLLSRAVGKRMKAAAGGVILNMGWDQAETGMEGDSGELFSAMKAAVMAFTRSLALSLAPTVRVNGLAPGWIRTAWGEGASAAWQERVLRETPLHCWGTPQDVASLARWLVSPAARYITGQLVRCNGGAIR